MIATVGYYSLSHADHASFADPDRLPHNAPASDKSFCANANCTIENGISGDVAGVTDFGIVLNQCLRVQYAILPDPRPCIDDSPMHEDGAVAYGRMARKVSPR